MSARGPQRHDAAFGRLETQERVLSNIIKVRHHGFQSAQLWEHCAYIISTTTYLAWDLALLCGVFDSLGEQTNHGVENERPDRSRKGQPWRTPLHK
jgi:hypothetical protein